jgi:hypothetical protein
MQSRAQHTGLPARTVGITMVFVLDVICMIIQLSFGDAMEIKTARLTVLVDPAKKKAFEALCASQDVTPSQVVRRLIRDYLVHHGVRFVPSGQEDPDEPAHKA